MTRLFHRLVWAWMLFASLGIAQEKTRESFETSSIGYRTALHYDPSLSDAFAQLFLLYQEQQRVPELLGMYQAHVAQYPADAGAKAVLLRILKAAGEDDEAFAQQAIAAHPEHAYLHFLHFEVTRELDSLSLAISLEPRVDRQMEWIDQLLKRATGPQERVLAERHLLQLRELVEGDAPGLLQLASTMHEFGFPELGFETVEAALNLETAPETNLALEVLAAKLEMAQDRKEDATKRLATLLQKLAPDHWRRSEIVALRFSMMDAEMAQTSLLDRTRANYAQNPQHAEAALDLAELLQAKGLREEASKVLAESSLRLPHVQVLERKALDLLQQLKNKQATIEFLEARLEQNPGRDDLRDQLVKSLFLAENPAAAEVEFTTLLREMSPEDRRSRHLNLARFLRRNSLTKEAVSVYQRALTEHPDTLELRQELAEIYLLQEDRQTASRLIGETPLEQIQIAGFLEFIEFLVRHDFLREAQNRLKERIAVEAESLDLHLRLVEVLGKIGDFSSGREQLQQSRDFVDTTAHYRQWLEQGLQFSAEFDRSSEFFSKERTALIGESAASWPQETIERFLVLCEVGKEHQQRIQVAELLRGQLDSGTLSSELAVAIRRQLVETLGLDPDFSLESESQLKALLEADPARSSEYHLRLALLYHSNQRPDLAQSFLELVDLDRVQQGNLLESIYPIYLDFGMSEPSLVALRRLTTVNASNPGIWEDFLNLLAGAGKETEFRTTISSLIREADRLQLGENSIATLNAQFSDSSWRSIASALEREDYPQILTLLEGLDHQLDTAQAHLWALWTRAYVMNQLAQTKARDEALRLLRKQVALADLEAVQFPDGLSLNINAAEEILRSSASVVAIPDEQPENQFDELSMRWGFEADPGSAITQIEAFESRVIVLDHRGTLYGLDRETGKLKWRNASTSTPSNLKFETPHRAAISQMGNSLTIQGSGNLTITGNISLHPGSQTSALASQSFESSFQSVSLFPKFVLDQMGGIFWANGRKICRIHLEDGRTTWIHELPEASDQGIGHLELGLVAGHLIVFDLARSSIAALDPESGKLNWSRLTSTEDSSGGTMVLNAGAAFGPRVLFTFGDRPCILDAATGETLWSLSASQVRTFPIHLRSIDQESKGPSVAQAHRAELVNRTASFPKSFLTAPHALVAPALQWNPSRVDDQQPRHAAILGEKLLLMGPDGVGVYSLTLPIGSRHYPFQGTYVGGTETRAAFLTAKGIHILDLQSGSEDSIPWGDRSEPTEAFVKGNRIYCLSPDGIRGWNLNTGNRVFQQSFPNSLLSSSDDQRAEVDSSEAPSFWQGRIVNVPEGRVCVPFRSTYENDTLFHLIDNSSFAALRPRQRFTIR